MKKFPTHEPIISKVLTEMERVFLLDDRRFAQEFLHHWMQKNVGRLKIISETRKRGLPNDLAESILLESDWSEAEAAGRAIEEKKRLLGALEERKKKQKLMQFLKNRGFSTRIIYSALDWFFYSLSALYHEWKK